MATLEFDLTSKRYRVRFRYGGRAFKRSLKTAHREEAEAVKGRIEETLRLIERGRIELPSGVDPGAFILSDGKRNGKQALETVLTLEQLVTFYQAALPEGAKENNTLTTERLHSKHLLRILGSHKPIQSLAVSDMQAYCDKRSMEKGKRGKVRAQTIKKELDTLRVIWNWGVSLGHLKGGVPLRGITLAKRKEQMPFQTWDEIQRIIDRGGLTEVDEKELWDCIFLTTRQISEVLELVRTNAPDPFLYAMFVFASHTGARRSEMMRSRVEDVDFETRTVLVREKKKDKSVELTYRRIPMSPQLVQVMSEWFAEHPGGAYTFCLRPNTALKQTFTTKCFRRSLKGSKWVRLRGFHVFRHSFASNLAAAGVDQRVIDEFMGHQTEEMRRRYRHLFPDQRRQAILSVFASVGE